MVVAVPTAGRLSVGAVVLVCSMVLLRRRWSCVVVEVRSLHVVVRSSHPSADEQVAEAIVRVVSQYAVDLSSGVEVAFPQHGVNVPYVAKRAMNLITHLREARAAARTPNRTSLAA